MLPRCCVRKRVFEEWDGAKQAATLAKVAKLKSN